MQNIYIFFVAKNDTILMYLKYKFKEKNKVQEKRTMQNIEDLLFISFKISCDIEIYLIRKSGKIHKTTLTLVIFWHCP